MGSRFAVDAQIGTLGSMLAVVCPGQGAQSPGMLSAWLEIASVKERLEEFGQAASLDVVTHGTTSDADTIRDTAIAQPLLVATALATGRELFPDSVPAVSAGHSVGEFGAAALAGVIADNDAMRLVTARGQAMAAAAADSPPTSMAAVLRGDPDEVQQALDSHGLTAANMNGASQVVAAGPQEAITALVAEPPRGTRVVELQVAGAFHTSYMEPAVKVLGRVAAETSRQDPPATLISNADGARVVDGVDAMQRLVHQVANPVRWDLCQETMLSLGVTAMIELAPGGVLTGLAKHAMKGVERVAVKTPDDLDAARQLMEAHA